MRSRQAATRNHAAVTVTTGLLGMMNREELEGVLAHEMSHIKNFDVRLLLVVTTMIGMAAPHLQRFLEQHREDADPGQRRAGGLAIGIVFTIIAVVVGPLMQLALSRAARVAGRCQRRGADPQPDGPHLCAAEDLRRTTNRPKRFNHAVAAMMIDNPDEHHGGFFSRLFDTHPPIAERIAALQRIASVQQT